MNKTLKKTLSIILTILMIVTTVPFAFAADEKAHDAVAVEFAESGFIKDNQSVNQWNYSSSYAEGPENMLDGDQYSKFCVVIYSNIAFSDLCDYYYVTAKTTYETAASISGYQFTTGNDAPERDPVSWKLYGSNDNINWTVIDSRENADIPEDRNSEVNFMLDKNSESYEFFRFEFEALREDQTTFQLSEIVLFDQHVAEIESCGGYVCSVCNTWYGEGAASHEKYTNGICDACGYKCAHKGMEDNICDDCGLECAHADATLDCRGYYCAACLSFYGEAGEHSFVNDTCSSCGIKGGSCGDSGDNVTWLLNDDGLLIISGEGNIYDYQADGVASPFGWNSEIKTAVIEDGITNIPSNLFNSCQNLKSVTIGNDVEIIDSMAFYYCNSLESVTIGNSVKSIGENAFLGNDSLKNVVIPDSVESIGGYAFYRCISLEDLTIGKGVKSIGERAFSECTALESVIIPENVETIGENAFAFCEGLKTLTISEGVKYIGENAFRNCYNLESVIIPDSIDSISNGAFYNCPKLESVTIPDSVTSIGDMAFTYCRNLKSITIPDSVTSIGEYAFSSCTSLENIIIGSNVTSIGEEAISDCDVLEILHFTGTEEQWEAIAKPADAADTINTIAVHFDTFEEKAGFAPTCGTDGHTAILYCTECDDYVSGEVIPATGDHDWSNKDGVCANSCGDICEHENQISEVCSVCGANLHTCDFSGEWKYDGSKHWKECECSLTSEEATHSFTDGKCVCGVERADYTAFDAAAEELRGLLEREDLLDGPKQGYTSGLNGVLNGVGYNRIEKEQMAVNNGTQTLNGYIDAVKAGIKDGSMIKADWSKMEALFDEINALIENDTNRIVDAYKGLYTGAQAYYNGCVNSATFTQQSYNNNIVYEQNLEELLAGLKDGTMLKFDGETESIKLQMDFIGAMFEMFEKYGEDRVREIEEKITENGNGEIASAIINEVAGLTGSVAENADKLAELKAEMQAFIDVLDRCCSGTHTFENYAETTPAKCGENAKETGTCWLCGETDEREIEGTALEHSFVDYKSNGDATCKADGTKTAECIHNCGETDTVADEGSKLDHADEDGDKVCDDCQAEIVDTCPDCGRPVHEEKGIPQFICFIIMLIRLVTSFFNVVK